MSGPGRPAYTDSITILEVHEDTKEVIFTASADLLAYLKQNGNSYVASFTPADASGVGASAEAPTS